MILSIRVPRFNLLAPLTLFALIAPLGMTDAHAQITEPRVLSAGDPLANLREQLVNQLRATRDDQQAYIDYIVEQIDEKKLDQRLVIAIERYAIRRNRSYPFPVFEKALHYEAAKRGLVLPPIQHFASTKVIVTSATSP